MTLGQKWKKWPPELKWSAGLKVLRVPRDACPLEVMPDARSSWIPNDFNLNRSTMKVEHTL